MGVFDQFLEQNEKSPDRVEPRSGETFTPDQNETSADMANFIESGSQIEGVQDAIVSGHPFEVAERMDYQQGDEVPGYSGTCAPASISNLLQSIGVDSSERTVVEYAKDADLCNRGWFFSQPGDRGGCNDSQIIKILDNFGVPAHVEIPSDGTSLNETIAQYNESGHRVTAGVNAGVCWDDPQYVGDGGANHQILITGSLRDADTGEVAGHFICDSGRGLESDSCRFVSADQFDAMCTNIPSASIVVTDRAYA